MCWSAAARAEFKGTPGKVASIGPPEDHCPLRIWDPSDGREDVVEPQTWSLPRQDSPINGFPSAPAWSPDGTKLAYTKEIEDISGDGITLRHTSIWIYHLDSHTSTPLTHPPNTTAPHPLSDPPRADGHSVADWAPAWSPDGSVVYFVRNVVAGPDDELYPQRGQNVWSVPATNGRAASQVTPYTNDGDGIIVAGVVAVPGKPGTRNLVLARLLFNGTADLAMWNGANAAPIVSSLVIADFDVAPDGSAVVWSQLNGRGVRLFMKRLATGETIDLGASSTPDVRFANDGSGVLHPGITDRDLEGLLERLIPDPDADIAPNEIDRFALEWTGFLTTFGTPGVPGRSGFDVQPQTLPIIFVPGFLGTTITCDNKTVWPSLGLGSSADLRKMQLKDDGINNAECPDAGPEAVVETVGFGLVDIYGTVATFLRDTFPNERVTLFGWDWRRGALDSLAPLDQAINQALETDGPWKDQGAKRVVLVGHSYGGLLINSYLREHPDRAARTLTIGTPYWGAPKSIFPLAFGIESPGFSFLDLLLNNAALQALAVNLAGLYHLYPSTPFGPWLTVDGVALPAGRGVVGFVNSIGGNVYLLNQAQAYHDVYDGFYDNTGRIDVRAVIGAGVETIGSVQIRTESPQDRPVEVINGDGTVPTKSGAQGEPGAAPMGDPIHRQYRCGVKHLDLPNDSRLLQAYRDFLDTGAVPRRLRNDPCPIEGGSMNFTGELGVAPQAPTGSQAPTGVCAVAACGTPVVGLDEAQTQELAQVIRLPNQTVVATNTRTPLTLRVQITDGSLTWRAHDGDVVGAAYVYGPLTGTLEITPSADVSALPFVTIDGTPVSPEIPSVVSIDGTPVSPETPSVVSHDGYNANGGCNAIGRSSGVVALAIVGLLRRRRARRTASERERLHHRGP